MKHPYKNFENSELWNCITRSMSELIDNGDIEICTPMEYVVGYICKRVLSEVDNVKDMVKKKDIK